MIEEIVSQPLTLIKGDILDHSLSHNSHLCLFIDFDEFLFLIPKYDTRHNMTSIFSIIDAQNCWFLASSQLSVYGPYIIPGEIANSDLSASVSIIKDRFTKILLNRQTSGSDETWEDSKFQI